MGGGRVRPSPAGGPFRLRDSQLPVAHHRPRAIPLRKGYLFPGTRGPWCWLPAPCGSRKECFLGHSWSPQSWKPLETSLIASGSRGRDQDVWDRGSWALTRDVVAEVTSGEMFEAEAPSHLCVGRMPPLAPCTASRSSPSPGGDDQAES